MFDKLKQVGLFLSDKLKRSEHKIRLFLAICVYIPQVLCLLYIVEALFFPLPLLHSLLEALWNSCPIRSLRSWEPLRAMLESMNPQGVSTVIGAIGVGGIFITWLTGISEQLVCKVRMGKLLNWAHPFFLPLYALVFFPTVFCGIYAGATEHRKATALALLGLSFGLIHMVVACLEFLLVEGLREPLALRFYAWQLHPSQQEEAHSQQVRQTMLQMADYMREQTTAYHRDISLKMVELWAVSCKSPDGQGLEFAEINEDFPYPAEYISGGQNAVVSRIFLSRDIWAQLLNGLPSQGDAALITHQILSSLGKKEKDEGYLVILLGFLFFLDSQYEDKQEFVEAVHRIVRGQDVPLGQKAIPAKIQFDLIYSLCMFLVIGDMGNGKENYRDALSAFAQRFSQHFGVASGSEALFRHTLLWYAEWAARLEHEVSLNCYMLHLNSALRPLGGYQKIEFKNFSYREHYLAMRVVCTLAHEKDVGADGKSGKASKADGAAQCG